VLLQQQKQQQKQLLQQLLQQQQQHSRGPRGGGGGARGPGPARVGLLGLQCSARALFRTASFKKNDTHIASLY
jgi:hypothetical protein